MILIKGILYIKFLFKKIMKKFTYIPWCMPDHIWKNKESWPTQFLEKKFQRLKFCSLSHLNFKVFWLIFPRSDFNQILKIFSATFVLSNEQIKSLGHRLDLDLELDLSFKKQLSPNFHHYFASFMCIKECNVSKYYNTLVWITKKHQGVRFLVIQTTILWTLIFFYKKMRRWTSVFFTDSDSGHIIERMWFFSKFLDEKKFFFYFWCIKYP